MNRLAEHPIRLEAFTGHSIANPQAHLVLRLLAGLFAAAVGFVAMVLLAVALFGIVQVGQWHLRLLFTAAGLACCAGEAAQYAAGRRNTL